MMKPAIIDFTKGDGISEIVGDKSYYQNDVNKFLADANFEFGWEGKEFTSNEVEEGYVKWYDDPFHNTDVAPLEIFEEGCYTFCDKNDEGAEEVFYIKIDE